MSLPQFPKPAKLVISVILMEKQLILPMAEALCKIFGSIDMVSPWFPFDYTSYYEAEMGKPLFRRIIVFHELIQQEALSRIKLATNDIEYGYLVNGNRQVNLDPGYLVQARFVLATGKDYSHRIYIGNGIYADLTLVYQKGAFRPLPWTYPDYASGDIRAYLFRIRNKYCIDLKKRPTGAD
jgi:hypothetical protein